MNCPDRINELSQMWLSAKTDEREAIEHRRAVEDQLRDALAVPESLDGASTVTAGAYTIRVTGRIDRKIDADLVQQIAAEHGLSEHLASLFRWKPEINARAWSHADPSITRILAPAITAKPGRPSFSITQE